MIGKISSITINNNLHCNCNDKGASAPDNGTGNTTPENSANPALPPEDNTPNPNDNQTTPPKPPVDTTPPKALAPIYELEITAIYNVDGAFFQGNYPVTLDFNQEERHVDLEFFVSVPLTHPHVAGFAVRSINAPNLILFDAIYPLHPDDRTLKNLSVPVNPKPIGAEPFGGFDAAFRYHPEIHHFFEVTQSKQPNLWQILQTTAITQIKSTEIQTNQYELLFSYPTGYGELAKPFVLNLRPNFLAN